MLLQSVLNADYFEFKKFENIDLCDKFESMTCIFVFLVFWGLYIDVLSVSMRSRVIFCIYIFKNICLDFFENFEIFEFRKIY